VTAKTGLQRKRASLEQRQEPRVHGLRQITVLYEGRKEKILIKPPDLSAHGMFISTNRIFPEGAVLKLRFQLAHSGIEIEARGEVRYCLPEVGVGIEFLGLSEAAEREIALEVEHRTKTLIHPDRKVREKKK
jgi:hypothetical protein